VSRVNRPCQGNVSGNVFVVPLRNARFHTPHKYNSSIRQKFEDADKKMRERKGKKTLSKKGGNLTKRESKWRRSQKIGRTGPRRKSVRRHKSSISSFGSSSGSNVTKGRTNSIRMASHRSSLRKMMEVEEKRKSMGTKKSSWQKTIRKKWKSSSSLSSMSSMNSSSITLSLSDVVEAKSPDKFSHCMWCSSVVSLFHVFNHSLTFSCSNYGTQITRIMQEKSHSKRKLDYDENSNTNRYM